MGSRQTNDVVFGLPTGSLDNFFMLNTALESQKRAIWRSAMQHYTYSTLCLAFVAIHFAMFYNWLSIAFSLDRNLVIDETCVNELRNSLSAVANAFRDLFLERSIAQCTSASLVSLSHLYSLPSLPPIQLLLTISSETLLRTAKSNSDYWNRCVLFCTFCMQNMNP